MTREQAESLVTDYNDLVQKAVAIFNKPGPPWGRVDEPEFARLTFDGEMAVLTYPKADTHWIEANTEKFPAALLFMSDEDLIEWRKIAKEEYEREQEERDRQRIGEREADQRRQYEALRDKFERR